MLTINNTISESYANNSQIDKKSAEKPPQIQTAEKRNKSSKIRLDNSSVSATLLC